MPSTVIEETLAELDPGPYPQRVRRWLGICLDGWPFLAIAMVITALCFKFLPIWTGILASVVTLWVAWFFRDPQRRPPGDRKAIVSPADGKIIDVRRVPYPRLLEGEATKISIFMSIFNVHVNRIPYTGVVRDVQYNPGKYFAAYAEKASLDNEQTAVLLETERGPILFVQIAGLIARRIVCRLSKGETVQRGERYGLIRFGSRCDIYLPTSSTVAVHVGDVVYGGNTVIGSFS